MPGQVGLERTYEEYVAAMVAVFRDPNQRKYVGTAVYLLACYLHPCCIVAEASGQHYQRHGYRETEPGA